jgi:hypothetical protein
MATNGTAELRIPARDLCQSRGTTYSLVSAIRLDHPARHFLKKRLMGRDQLSLPLLRLIPTPNRDLSDR